MKFILWSIMTSLVLSCVKSENKTGMAGLIIEDGTSIKTVIAGSANLEKKEPVNEYTNFRMASVSKQFTAACIILLKNDGLLDYSDKLSTFFDNFNFGNQVSLADILTHTSGLLDYESMIPDNQKDQILDADVLKWVSGADSLYFKPGSQYRYSNTGFCILSQVVEKVSKLPFEVFVANRIFKPLGMDNSYIYLKDSDMANRAVGYAINETGEIYENDQSLTSATKGDGCVYTSLEDYKKWIKSLADNTLFNLTDELNKVARPIAGENNLSYGLGWFVYDDKELYHTGSTSGFSNVIWMSKDAQNAIVYFSNLADNHAGALPLLEGYLNVRPEIDFMKVLKLTD